MSVFAQYVPYDARRGHLGRAARRDRRRAPRRGRPLRARRRATAWSSARSSARPTSRRRIGLTGGHIFQGECLPDQMWDRRFAPRTPVPGLYLCGAATHPGGSVIGVNGRNAAMAVLEDIKT